MSRKRNGTKQTSVNEPVLKKRKLNREETETDDGEEDDDGTLLTAKLDYDIQTGLYALRNDDPLIYDRDYSFIKHDNEENKDDKDIKDDDKYPWVKQLDDKQQDIFLKQFFSEQLWKCKNDTVLSSVGVYRGYEGNEHNLDDIDLSDDDLNVDKQNDFERDWQKKNALEFDEELNKQNDKILNNHQNHNKNGEIKSKIENSKLVKHDKAKSNDDNEDTWRVLQFLEESD